MMEPNTAGPETDAKTILVVESDVVVRIELAAYLRDCGYRVFEMSTAEEAISIIQSVHRPVDLVLADVQSPEMGGFALARWIRTERAGLKIILTGNPDKAAEAASELCDADPTLKKPFDVQILIDRIRRALASR
jgi:DNA-binding response OmpR family regulator